MRVDLAGQQRAADVAQGRVTGADGLAYSRRTSKAKRTLGDELVAAGTPLVLEMYSNGQFEWLDDEDAKAAWTEIRDYLITTEPSIKCGPRASGSLMAEPRCSI